MRKLSLQDVKQQNTELILHSFFKSGVLSRVRLAELCGLSASTVTLITRDLLNAGLLREVGDGDSSGGRKPIELCINPALGTILVFSVRRVGLDAAIYDAGLNRIGHEHYPLPAVDGETVLETICGVIREDTRQGLILPDKILGLGLLFQDDMQAGDFNVMFSTSVSSDNIPLLAALQTRLHVPIVEDFSASVSVSDMLAAPVWEDENFAYLRLGKRLLLSLIIEKKPVSISGRESFDLTDTLLNSRDAGDAMGLMATSASNGRTLEYPLEYPAGIQSLAMMFASLMALFPIRYILVNFEQSESESFCRELTQALQTLMGTVAAPVVQTINVATKKKMLLLAEQIRLHGIKRMLSCT